MRKLIAAVLAMIVIATTACVAAHKGNVKVAGSTTVLPIAQLWAEEYMAKYPGADVSVAGGGTGTGISSLINGTCDIADASREVKPKEIAAARDRNSKIVGTKIAKDGMAIIVNESNNVKNITIPQLAAVYSGRMTSWKQLGGESRGAIVAIGRDSSSGTYGFFQDSVLGGGAYRKDMLSEASNAAVALAVGQTKDGMGYVGMAFAEEAAAQGKVRILSISRKTGEPGMKPTVELVRSEKYPLFRFLYMYTLGKPTGAVADFIKFGLSDEGQKLVSKAEYVSVR